MQSNASIQCNPRSRRSFKPKGIQTCSKIQAPWIAIAIVSAEDYWTLVATCCNIMPTSTYLWCHKNMQYMCSIPYTIPKFQSKSSACKPSFFGLHFAQVGIAFSESFIFCGLAETQLLHGYADISLASSFAVVEWLEKTTCTCSIWEHMTPVQH